MNKFLAVFFSFVLSGAGVGYVYVSNQLEVAFAASQPTGHDIGVRMEHDGRVDRLVSASSQGEVEELFPSS